MVTKTTLALHPCISLLHRCLQKTADVVLCLVKDIYVFALNNSSDYFEVWFTLCAREDELSVMLSVWRGLYQMHKRAHGVIPVHNNMLIMFPSMSIFTPCVGYLSALVQIHHYVIKQLEEIIQNSWHNHHQSSNLSTSYYFLLVSMVCWCPGVGSKMVPVL